MTRLEVPTALRERSTLSAEAYQTLRSAVLSRQLVPGQKLNVRELSEQLTLSATPIKEALHALMQEGLVVAVPRRGYFVPEPDDHALLDLYLLRSVTEGLGARLAAERSRRRLNAPLRAALRRMEGAVAAGDVEAYGNLDFGLHRLIWEGSLSAPLVKSAETLSGQIRVLMRQSNQQPGRLTTSLEEHRQIVDAVLGGDGPRAETEMRAHLEQAARLMTA